MKKNVLALSITAAMLGLAGGAQAMVTAPLTGARTGSALVLNEAGVGHSLFVPYFTAQDTNSTLLNLVNTDRVNGKAVKIRFRGAANSDDLFDFQVFLSPGDVWTASISKGADGYAKLTTNDASCTKPAKAILNATPFKSTRLDTANLVGDALMAGTREGYVEIFNMADIPPSATTAGALAAAVQHPNYPGAGVAGDLGATATAAAPATLALLNADYLAGAVRNVAGAGTWTGAVTNTTNALFTAIKHVNKVAPCAATSTLGGADVFAALDTADQTDVFTANAAGMLAPTSGLMANWTIINVVGAAAWSGQATAIRSTTGGVVPVTGHLVYWPQTGITATTPEAFTADPLLRVDAQIATDKDTTTAVTHVAGTVAITALFVDLPDMSTPYTLQANLPVPSAFNNVSAGGFGAAVNIQPLNQAAQLTASLATRSITNEYLTDPAISASTDLVFSMPTKRYSTAFHYGANVTSVAATTAGATFDDGRRFSELVDDNILVSMTNGYFTSKNTVINPVSASNVNGRQICVTGITGPAPYDREESTVTSSTAVVVSPAPVTPTTSFCGEASVMSISNGGTTSASAALKSTVTRKDATLPYVDGWIVMGTPGASTTGLPVLGASFVKAVGGTSTFGATYSHRYVR